MNSSDFTDEILRKIELMGANGKTTPMIAIELNVTSSELQDYRHRNFKLDLSLKRAEYNSRQFMIARMEADCINGKNTTISKEVYARLTDPDKNKDKDNEIIIRRV